MLEHFINAIIACEQEKHLGLSQLCETIYISTESTCIETTGKLADYCIRICG